MKRILFILAIIGLSGNAIAQNKGISFENELSWTQIKAKAKAENKFILMDVFATWCGPCKYMDSVYTSEKLGTFINDKFVSVKVQMDSTTEDNQRVRSWYNDVKYFSKEYKIGSYPSLLFFDQSGLLVHKTVGAMTDSSLLMLATNVLNPSNQFYSKLNLYRAGKLAYEDMPALVKMAMRLNEVSAANGIAMDYIDNYLLRLERENLFCKTHLDFLADFLINTNSSAFKFLLNEQRRINAIMGKFYTENRLMSIINKEYLPQSIGASKTANWDSLERKLTAKFGLLGLEIAYGQRMVYHFMAEDDWQTFGEYYLKYFEKGIKRSRYEINNMSWAVFEHVGDPKVLKFACDIVMKFALEEFYQNTPNAYDTYANLLYKTGRKGRAIEWEKKALRISNNDPAVLVTLEKMRNDIKTWTIK